MEQHIPVTALFSSDLEQKARLTAAIQRISRSELVRRAVAAYLTRLTTENDKKEANDGRKN